MKKKTIFLIIVLIAIGAFVIYSYGDKMETYLTSSDSNSLFTRPQRVVLENTPTTIYSGDYEVISSDGFTSLFDVTFEKQGLNQYAPTEICFTKKETTLEAIKLELEDDKFTIPKDISLTKNKEVISTSKISLKQTAVVGSKLNLDFCYTADPTKDFQLKFGDASTYIAQIYKSDSPSYQLNTTSEGSNATHLIPDNTTATGGAYSSLVGYWNFDGDRSATTAYDWSHSSDGVYTNGASISSNCVYDNCTSLDGTDDFIDITPTFAKVAYPYTISLWVKTTACSTTTNKSIIGMGRTSSATPTIGLGIRGESICTIGFLSSTGVNESSANISDNQWHHIVGIWENESVRHLYIDNILNYTAIQLWATSTTIEKIYIGARPRTPTGTYFKGSVDEVMIFKTNLTADNITAIYTNASKRFFPVGTQELKNFQIDNSNRINISFDDFENSFGSNISLQLGEWNITKEYNLNMSGLDVYFNFDNRSEIGDSSTNIQGRIKGNNGTAVNGVTFTDCEFYEKCVNLDGNTDYVKWNTTTDIQTDSFSVVISINSTQDLNITNNNSRYIVSRMNSTSGWAIIYGNDSSEYAGAYTTGLNFILCDGVETYYIANYNGNLNAYKSYQIIGTYDNVTHNSRLYLNGIQVGTQSGISFVGISGKEIGAIGDKSQSLTAKTDDNFHGRIDEFMMFNRSLTAEEVKILYVEGRANWNFNTSEEKNITQLKTNYTFIISNGTTNILPKLTYQSNTNRFYSPILFDNIILDTWAVAEGEAPSTDLTDCGDLTLANTVYQLKNNVTSLTTCFTVKANNVTLIGNYYQINYSQNDSGGYAFYSYGYNYSSIFNSTIVSGNSTATSYGIYYYKANNGTIKDNVINTYGEQQYPIYLYKSGNDTIMNNRINTSVGNNDYSIYIQNSSYNSIDNNTIGTKGTYGRGIFLEETSNNNLITTNNIISTGTYGYGIRLYTNSTNNIVNNNTVINTNDNSHGIFLEKVLNNIISNNTISVTSTADNAYGLYLLSDANNNNISENNVTNAISHGIRLETNSDNNKFNKNWVRTTASSTYVLYIIGGSHSFTFTNDILNITSTTGDFYISSDVTGGVWNFTNVTGREGNAITTSWTAGANGTLNKMWWMNINATKASDNSPISGAIVEIYNNNSILENQTITGADGLTVLIPIKEYINYNRTNRGYFSNYAVNVSATGYANFSNSTINFTTSMTIFTNMTLAGATAITDCGVLNSAGTYELQKNVTATGTCFTITANNIIFDGMGYEINYSSNGTVGYGFNVTGYNFTTIKNGIIKEANVTNSYKYPVYLYKSYNNNITNNTIYSNGTSSYAIYLNPYSSNNTVSYNTIRTTGSSGFGIFGWNMSNYNIVKNNDIITYGGLGYGIYFYYDSSNNLIDNNTVTTLGDSAYVIRLYGNCNNNLISNNTAISTNSYSYDYLIYTSNNATLINNQGNSTRTSSYVIYGENGTQYQHNIGEDNLAEGKPFNYTYNADNLIIENKDYTGYGEVAFGYSRNITIRNSNFTDDSLNLFYTNISTIEGNNFTTSKGHGIYLYSQSNYNNIINNSIRTFGTNGFGIYLYKNVFGNQVWNNSIIASGINGQGIFLNEISNNHYFNNNSITTSGSNGQGVIMISSAHNNTFYNMFIKTNYSNAYAVYIYSDDNTFSFTDSILNSSYVNVPDFYIRSISTWGSWNFTNTTRIDGTPINMSWISGGNGTLNMFWWIDVNATKSTDNSPLQNANITIYDNNTNIKYSKLTDANGMITPYKAQEYKIINKTKIIIYYTPYNLTAIKSGYGDFTNDTINLTVSSRILVNMTSSETPEVIQILYPNNYTVIQRDNATAGVINISGNYSGSTITSVDARWGTGEWTTINSSFANGFFTGNLNVSVGNNTLQIMGTGYNYSNWTNANVMVGDVFVIMGQSNAVNFWTIQDNASMNIKPSYFRDINGRWNTTSNSTTASYSWTSVANAISKNQNIPVGIIYASVNGVDITTYQKDQLNYNMTIQNISIATNGTMKIKGAFWFQGETNMMLISTYKGNYTIYKRQLIDMVNNLSNDLINFENMSVGITGYYGNDTTNTASRDTADSIRKAQWDAINESGKLIYGTMAYDVPTALDTNTPVHFYATDEKKALGERWINSSLRGFYNLTSNYAGDYPRVQSITYNETFIRIVYSENVTIRYWNGTQSTKAMGWRIQDLGVFYNDSNISSTDIDNNIVYINLTTGSANITKEALLSLGSKDDAKGYPIIVSSNYSMPSELIFVMQDYPSLSLTINGVEGDTTILNGSTITLTGTTLLGDSSSVLQLFKNGTEINYKTSPITNNSLFDIPGYYNITLYYNSSQNYTRGILTRWVNVTLTPPIVIYDINFTNPTPANNSIQTGNSIYVNITTNDTREHYVFNDFDKSLIFWMTFDETNATNSSIFIDRMGHANGTAVSNATQGTGKWNKDVEFTTNNASGDYVNLSNTLKNSLYVNYTVSAWVYIRNITPPAGQGIVTYRAGTPVLFQLSVGVNTIAFFVRNDSGSTATASNYYRIVANKWHHVVGTRNDTALVVWVDGLNGTQALINNTSGWINATNFEIGRILGSANSYLNGSVDDVLIFNRTLNGSEIRALYNATNYKYYNNFSVSNGLHTTKGYMVDTDNNINSTEERIINVSVYYDITPPSMINPTESPVDPTTYVHGGNYTFTIDVTDSTGVNSVWILFNGTNYSASNTTATIWNVTVYNYGGGTYTYNWSANDTSGNLNNSIGGTYTINKAISLTYTYINHARHNKVLVNSSLNINLTGVLVLGVGNISLFINDTLSAEGLSPVVNITNITIPFKYVINTTYLGNENYTPSYEVWNLTITTLSITKCNNIYNYTKIPTANDKPYIRLCKILNFK